jgi:hypothetical protein
VRPVIKTKDLNSAKDCIKINYYKRMFSKVISRVSKYQQLTALQSCAFRASTVANVSKKPSIGDAVTILQSKVSGINQVVSNGTDAPPRHFPKRLKRAC